MRTTKLSEFNVVQQANVGFVAFTGGNVYDTLDESIQNHNKQPNISISITHNDHGRLLADNHDNTS